MKLPNQNLTDTAIALIFLVVAMLSLAPSSVLARLERPQSEARLPAERSRLSGPSTMAADAAEGQCRSEAKAQATRIYRACMRQANSQRLHQLKEDYENRLKQLQEEYETELKNLSEQSQLSRRVTENSENSKSSSGNASNAAIRKRSKSITRQNTLVTRSLRGQSPGSNLSQSEFGRLESEFDVFDQAQEMDLPEPIPVEDVPLIGR
jgi:flagellar motility protein MotE (MotC chaperone)